jgi:hypothetical protein
LEQQRFFQIFPKKFARIYRRAKITGFNHTFAHLLISEFYPTDLIALLIHARHIIHPKPISGATWQ